MKPDEIKVGHIYYVGFDPVDNKHKLGEFAKKHLAIVLAKSSGEVTYIVIPTTSQEKGNGVNKIDLGLLDELPDNLKDSGHHTYAVLDQIQSVSYQRFSPLFNGGSVVDVRLPEDKMIAIYKAVFKYILRDIPSEEILKIIF